MPDVTNQEAWEDARTKPISLATLVSTLATSRNAAYKAITDVVDNPPPPVPGTWPADAAGKDPHNMSEVAAFKPAAALADLATLKASGTLGDGHFTGAFTAGQYIVLADGTDAVYENGAWRAV